jgi:hypothetical protein
MRGGLRSRLVLDSVRLTIIAALEQLGWFDPTVYDTPPGARTHRPLTYIPRPTRWDDPIFPNALAISAEDISDEPLGLGGDVEDRLEMYIDVFAQDDIFGWQLSHDVRDILLGKYPELGRIGPWIDVYDLRQATPAPITQVEVDDVRVDRTQGEARDWQRHWFMTRLTVLDDYADEADAVLAVDHWADEYRAAWDRIQAIELVP